MTSASSGLIAIVCGIYLQLNGCLLTNDSSQLIIRNMSSWIEAYNNPPNISYQLISPFLAVKRISEMRALTQEPIYVNGFTYGAEDEGGVVIQLSNLTEKFDIYCTRADGGYDKPAGKFTYESGRERCSNHGYTYPGASAIGKIEMSFRKTVFWMEDFIIPPLFSENVTIHCMVLDLDEGQLMLDNCNRTHEAVYVQGDYRPTIKKYTNASLYPFYSPNEDQEGTTTTTGIESTSASVFSTDHKPSKTSTKQQGQTPTEAPDHPASPGTTDKSQDIFGMSPDIIYALVSVGSVVVLICIICVCCYCKRRKGETPRRSALSNDYSNPVDSIGVNDIERNSNSNNGVYANPQDSINPVKAKKRDSIGEGVYDVTFTSGQRKPNVNPNQQPSNAYAHVTIQPQGGAQVEDDTENHYDSTSYMKPQQKVFISPSHSDGTYGEVKIVSDT